MLCFISIFENAPIGDCIVIKTSSPAFENNDKTNTRIAVAIGLAGKGKYSTFSFRSLIRANNFLLSKKLFKLKCQSDAGDSLSYVTSIVSGHAALILLIRLFATFIHPSSAILPKQLVNTNTSVTLYNLNCFVKSKLF